MLISTISVSSVNAEDNLIPEWVKSIAGWYSEDRLTDDEFIEAIAFLLENEIIEIEGYGKLDQVSNFTIPTEIPRAPESISGFTLQTDKDSYESGEKIIVTGSIPIERYDSNAVIATIIKRGSTFGSDYSKNLELDKEGNFNTTVPVAVSRGSNGEKYLIEGETFFVRVSYYDKLTSLTVLEKEVNFEGYYYEELEYEAPTMPDPIQSNHITVQTDKSSYSIGDTILVTGEVTSLLSGYSVSVFIKDIYGETFLAQTIPVSDDKQYDIEIITNEIIEGSYSITVQYGSAKNNMALTIISIN